MATNQVDIFREPYCLIDTDKGGKLCVIPEVSAQLETLDKPLVIVAIAGLYRTGKSYLLNRLAGKSDGFALGSTIQSKTKGIWVWVTRHPLSDDKYLVLLDTEGLGDAEKGDANHDNWIFALATLLSSVLVYNALGTINEEALSKLNFITEISKHISNKSEDRKGHDSDFDCFFPLFIFVLRDFTLELEINGREVTSDEYLENCLTLKHEKNEVAQKYNKPRLCIRKYFKNRKCFTFDRPVSRKKLKDLEKLNDKDLSEDFVEEMSTFVKYANRYFPVKKLETGQPYNGRMLATIITTYVEAIRGGAVPCVENAINALALIENSRAIHDALELYKNEMMRLPLPTKDDKTLNDHHFSSLQKAVKLFLDKAILDEDNKFQEELNNAMKNAFEQYSKGNEEASRQKCIKLLQELGNTLQTKLRNGQYAKNGGFAEFQHDLKSIQQQYMSHTDLGVKMNETILSFMLQKAIEGESVLAVDQKVSEEEKKVQAERQKAIEAQMQRELAQREVQLTSQLAEEKERALQENIKQMEETSARQFRELKEHYDKVTNDRLQEQQRLLQEGFKREANLLRAEIDNLKPKPKKSLCIIM